MKPIISFLFLLLVLGLSATWLSAAPSITAVAATPLSIGVNSPTTVVITASITDPLLLPESVTLLRLSSDGSGSATVVGILNDNGVAGDAVAGDHLFTSSLQLDESYPGPIAFEVTAAFIGTLRRVISSPVTIIVQGLTLATVVTNTPYIVEGTVASATSYTSAANIFTDLTFSVTRMIKGSVLSSPITVKTLGGTVGGQTQTSPFATPFVVGQQAILFLSGPTSDNKYYIPDGPLGTFHLSGGSGTDLAIIDSGYSTIETQSPLDPSYTALLSQSSSSFLTVDALIAAILTP
jgi:hypothetical protein